MFITLEGIEGCGKSTQAQLLAKRLRQEGHRTRLTREPGGTAIGRQIRAVILSTKNRGMSAEAELGLYFSDRAQHLRELVWPELEAGSFVVCDRFTDSTLAYQGYGRGIPLAKIRALDKALTGGYRPDVTLLFDLTPDEGLKRARSRNRASASRSREGRFEEEALRFHERVRAGYLQMARRESQRFRIVPAEGSRARVHELAWEALRRAL